MSEALQEAVKENIWLCHTVITCKYLKEFTHLSNFFAYMQKLDRQTTKSKQKLFTSFKKQYYLHYNWETPCKFIHVSIHLLSASHADWQWWHRIDKVKQILFWQEDIAGGKNCFLFLFFYQVANKKKRDFLWTDSFGVIKGLWKLTLKQKRNRKREVILWKVPIIRSNGRCEEV